MSDHGIQHKRTHAAPTDFGFGDEGERVPVVVPEQEDDGDPRHADSPCADRLEILRGLVELMTTDATVKQTGQRMHLLAYFFGLSGCKTHAEFARELNVSPGRVSQILRELPEQLRSLAHSNSRAAKARGVGRKDRTEI